MSEITIRTARASDERALERLAALDSQRIPTGDVLLAELCARPVAAIERATMRVVADPFERTADVVDLLKVRAGAAARGNRRSTVVQARLRAA